MTKARRLRLRGPKTRLERFLTWRKGPLTTERLAILLIILLCYINAQMLLAIYVESNDEDMINNGPYIDLGFNPIAHHEQTQRGLDTRKASSDSFKDVKVEQNDPAQSLDADHVIVSGKCPENVDCGENQVHIYAESGPHKSKICLNGKEVLQDNKADGGINLVVINPERKTAGSVHNFQNSDIDMVDVLENINDERIVVLVAQEDASVSLSPESRLAVETLGSTLIHDVAWRSSWAFIGQVGISGVSPHETMRHVVEEWAPAVAVSQCVPHHIDGESVLDEARKEFCDLHDTYGEFCKKTWTRPQALPADKDLTVSSLPIAIISRDRGPALLQSLNSLFRVPGLDPRNVIVFQDGYSSEILSIVRQFGVRLVRLPKVTSQLLNAPHLTEGDVVSTVYRRMFDVIWGVNPKKCLYPDKDYLIVLEDDLIVTHDMFNYLNQLLPVLNADKSLLSASVWNANAVASSTNDLAIIYRTETFPGHGWIISQESWREVLEPGWPKCCHGINWLSDVHKLMKRRGMDCLYPEAPRVYTKSSKLKHETLEVYTELSSLDNLDKVSYRAAIADMLRKAEVLDHSGDPCKEGFIPQGDRILVMYYYQRNSSDITQVAALAACMWNGAPVTGVFEGVLRTRYHGNQLLLVGSETSFSRQSMSESVQPFRIAKYKDR